MQLLIIYLLILLAGLLLFSIRKPWTVVKPLYLKYASFAITVVAVYAVPAYAKKFTPVLFSMIALFSFYEIFRAVRQVAGRVFINLAALLTGGQFIASAFIPDFPHAELFLCVLSFDSFSQFTGQLSGGKTSLCKSISPHKTVEGLLGGLGMCVLTAHLTFHFFAMGFFIAFTALAGDLLASYVKRLAGIKDFGCLLPGQGGMLDRFDSYIFTTFVYSLCIICQTYL